MKGFIFVVLRLWCDWFVFFFMKVVCVLWLIVLFMGVVLFLMGSGFLGILLVVCGG